MERVTRKSPPDADAARTRDRLAEERAEGRSERSTNRHADPLGFALQPLDLATAAETVTFKHFSIRLIVRN